MIASRGVPVTRLGTSSCRHQPAPFQVCGRGQSQFLYEAFAVRTVTAVEMDLLLCRLSEAAGQAVALEKF